MLKPLKLDISVLSKSTVNEQDPEGETPEGLERAWL